MKPHEEETQKCLVIEDRGTAFSCIKKVVEKYSKTEVCRPKLVLLVQDECSPCKEQTALHKGAIDKGIIQKINVATSQGKDIIKKNGIEGVPSLILLDCNDKIIDPV